MNKIRRRKIQDELERWALDFNVGMTMQSPAFQELLEMISRLDLSSGDELRKAVEVAYQRGFDAGRGQKG